MDNILLSMTAGAFILVGLLTGAFFSYRIFQAAASKQWPFVLGELESNDLREVVYRGRDYDGTLDQASAWVVNFSYSYTVAGKTYRGKRVTFSDGINKTMHALRRLQDKYQGKSQIQVYYNPKNPAQSLLVPGLSIFNFTPLITSTLFILAGVFIQTFDFS